MNKARRKAIEEIIGKLEELKDQLETLSTEELEAYDNLPESIQSSERGERMSEGVDDIDNATGSIEDAIYTLTDLIER
jgi:septation ring formation regulator EzrA